MNKLKLKMKMIGAGDSQSLLNHFKRKHSEDPMFFYTVQVDQENRMTNFFFGEMGSQGLTMIALEMFWYSTPPIAPINTT